MTFELIAVVLLILVNGFFVLSEMSVVVSRRVKLRQMAVHSRRAASALELTRQTERVLSTVQVWCVLAILLIGAYGGPALGKYIAGGLLQLGLGGGTAQAVGLLLSVALITYPIVVFGELLPKRVALLAPERIASQIAWPMQLAARLSAPFTWLLSRSIRLLMRLLRLDHTLASHISDEEIRLLLMEGHEQGVIDVGERNMLNRMVRLSDRTAENLMTPRTRIEWLDVDASLETNLEILRTTPYSCYPVYRGSDSDVVGILETKSLTSLLGHDAGTHKLLSLLSEPLFVSESTRALALVDIFRDHGAHLALVVDEYGDLQGLVTLNDLFGAVFGPLQSQEAEPGAGGSAAKVRQPDDSFRVDGSLASEDLRELLELSQLPNEDQHDYNTAAGMVVSYFGHIPAPGEFFDYESWRVEVLSLDGARIDKLRIYRLPTAADNDG